VRQTAESEIALQMQIEKEIAKKKIKKEKPTLYK